VGHSAFSDIRNSVRKALLDTLKWVLLPWGALSGDPTRFTPHVGGLFRIRPPLLRYKSSA